VDFEITDTVWVARRGCPEKETKGLLDYFCVIFRLNSTAKFS
jgi:hypothetical protein